MVLSAGCLVSGVPPLMDLVVAVVGLRAEVVDMAGFEVELLVVGLDGVEFEGVEDDLRLMVGRAQNLREAYHQRLEIHRNRIVETARRIDDEIRTLVDEAEARARGILTEHIDELHAVARALLEYETLTGDEIVALLRGESIHRPSEEEPRRAEGVRSAVPSTDDGKEAPGGLKPEPQPGS